MSVITFVCAGQMNSAITFPAFENGHEVRLVGSPLDRDIIDGLRKDNFHITLKRTLHDGIKYYQIEELEEALIMSDVGANTSSKFSSTFLKLLNISFIFSSKDVFVLFNPFFNLSKNPIKKSFHLTYSYPSIIH